MDRINDTESSNTEDLPAFYGDKRVPACGVGPDVITDRPPEDDANVRWPNTPLRQKPVLE